MTPAVGYVRVSGQGQMDGDGPERQTLAIRRYAEANGLRIVKIYTEAGVSGTKGEDDRPAFAEMLREGRADVVVFESLDRLARDLMMSETLLGTLTRRGITAVSTREPDLCSNDPTRILIRHILSAIAEWDRRVTVAKLRGARQRMRARSGRCEGRKPYGYLHGEAGVVELMRQIRSDGESWTQIADRLNYLNVLTRSGGKWDARTVQRIVMRTRVPEVAND